MDHRTLTSSTLGTVLTVGSFNMLLQWFITAVLAPRLVVS